jgi:hypothetical protein
MAPQQAPALQVQLAVPDVGAISASDLQKQIDATVTSLEGQLAAIERNIAQLNESMLSGSNFENLNATVPLDSELAQAIANAYPALFNSGVFSSTAWQTNSDALLAAGQAQAAKLLDLADASALPTVNSPDAPLTNTIAQLEEQLRALRRQIEVENARRLQFAQQRDLAWESVQALSNKQAELQLARAAANSEVRLSGRAVPLDEPVPQLSLTSSLILAAFAGLLLGVIVAFVREFTMQSSAPISPPQLPDHGR